MILTCPSCQSQYLIPDGSIGEAGRTVKCTSCAHKWHQSGADDHVIHVDAEIFEPVNTAEEPEINETDDIDDEPERFFEAEQTPQGSLETDSPVTLKAVGFAFILFMALFSSIFTTGRQFFVERWEPIAKVFDVVGLPVPVAGEGLALESVTANVTEIDGEAVLIVKGRIDNISESNIILPVLKISTYDDNDWLKDWVIPLGGKIMQSQQSVAFDYRLSDIPTENDKITVTFAYE